MALEYYNTEMDGMSLIHKEVMGLFCVVQHTCALCNATAWDGIKKTIVAMR